jgi:hypothetical protein
LQVFLIRGFVAVLVRRDGRVGEFEETDGFAVPDSELTDRARAELMRRPKPGSPQGSGAPPWGGGRGRRFLLAGEPALQPPEVDLALEHARGEPEDGRT